jgi:hypothetical protein
LNHQGVDIDQAGLEQVQRQDGDLLVVESVGRDLPALAIENELIGAVPVLDYVEPLTLTKAAPALLKMIDPPGAQLCGRNR